MQFTTKSGYVVEVDDDRADLAALRGWYMHSSGYIGREVRVDGRRKIVFLHHLVLGVEPERGRRVDHVDRDRLNNRRENLRTCTPSQNAQNRSANSKRGLPRGVTWKADKQRWCARGMLDGRSHNVGYFKTVEEAADAIARWRAEHMPFSPEAMGAA